MEPWRQDEMDRERQMWAYKVERRRRMRLSMAVVPGLLGAFGLLIALVADPYLIEERFRISITFIWAVTLTLLGVSGSGLLWIYLQTGFRSIQRQISSVEYAGMRLELDKAIRASQPEIKRLTEDVAKLKEQITLAKAPSAQLSESDYVDLVTTIKEQITSGATFEVMDEIKRLITDDLDRKQRLELQDATRNRLREGLGDITRRGVTNLWFGLLISVGGLATLGYFVIETAKSSTENLSLFAIHFVPRLAVVVLIEVFAYFFLGLYKSSLAEIKYFQNELTNVEAKYLALQIASVYQDDEALRAVIQKLAGTERNFVLDKGQTTVELEKSKIERESVTTMLQSLIGVLSPLKKS